MNEADLGKQLQAARQKAGLTQQQLCQKSGLSYSTLAKIERGAIKSPSVFTIAAVADVIGTSLDALMGRSGTSVPASDKKVSKSGVRFIYFDVNGCLVRFFHRAFTKLADDTNIPTDVIETFFWRYNDQVCRGDMTMDEFNQKLADALKVPKVDWLEYYLAEVDPITEMHELVRWAAQHYDVGLVTNIMPGAINVLREKSLIPDVNYACVIDSSEVKSIKPEQQIYEIAQEKAGYKPEEILLVDDTRANVIAAGQLGWHVIWFDDFRSQESTDRVRKALEFANESKAQADPEPTQIDPVPPSLPESEIQSQPSAV